MHTDLRLLVFIVTYNAEKHIEGVLDKIPQTIWQDPKSDVLIIDDASPDNTYLVCQRYIERTGKKILLKRNAINRGYGGNQKLGYQFALDNAYDAVVLLHGDGQYNPTLIPQLVEPIYQGSADIVIGSRMMNKKDALSGGMPLYKFVANIILTFTQNKILGYSLSEFHSGYRVYTASLLRKIPFQKNSNYFDFDTDILIQCLDNKARICEIAIPTFYGDEVCYVNGIKYAVKIMLSTIASRLQRIGLLNLEKFRY